MAKARLLILDDFDLSHLEKKLIIGLMEITEDRYGGVSNNIASQLHVVGWFDIAGEATIADSILYSPAHYSHGIELGLENLK